MRNTRLLLVATILTSLSAMLGAEQPPETRTVTDRYLELTLSQQYDALLELYAPDAIFHDPTADVFQGQIAQGPIQGVEAIIAMQKSWRLAETTFDIRASFSVGQYSLYRGALTLRYQGAAARFTIPLVTVLRAEQGHISERLDFGEYIESSGLGEAFDDSTTMTRRVADRYLDAYLSGDLAVQTELAASDIRFQDPTAKIFGAAGDLLQGAEELMSRRRQQLYKNVSNFDLDVSESFYANHHAVYMGMTSYSLRSGQSFIQPAVFVIEVRDGKVSRQWDFVDYTVGPTEP